MKLIALQVVGTAALLLLVVLLSPAPARASPSADIVVLFDFGDGTYRWANATVPDPSATNATWLAVKAAAGADGIPLLTAWYSGFGVGILDVGDRHPPAGFVGLYEWNATAHGWGLANAGISSLVVSNGTTLALYNAGFDSVTFASRMPIPTPDDPYPSVEFRGDLGNSGTSQSPFPGNVGVRWDRDTGAREIEATPAVANGKVFVATRNGTFALDADTGQVLWIKDVARGFSSPAVFDNSVIVGTVNGTVVRLNATDGSVQWHTRLPATTSFSGITSSPKVSFDHVFVGTFNESGGLGEVVSLWASNGTVAWRHPTGSVDYSSPAVANGTVYVGVMGRYNKTSQVTFDPPFGVLALDAANGTERWFFRTTGSVAASPAIAGSRLIATSKDGQVYAIDRSTGRIAWNGSVDAGISSPAVSGNSVFVGSGSFGGSGRVWSLDLATGSPKWYFTPNGPVQASISYARGFVVFATNTANGTVYALNATTGRLAWNFEPSPKEYILGSPVVADGIVFAPSDNGHVYALAEVPGTGPPPPFQPSILFYLLAIGGPLGIIAVVVAVLVRRRSRRAA